MMVAKEAPVKCEKCGGTLRQDEDVLDTWFSSALWPYSTLGWPEETPDYKYFYPTDVLVTGYDIIFFWVVRMVFSALEATGEVPFHTVYVHGLVRDSEGRKMSKSLGNGIDPLLLIDEVGADALRFMLTTGNTPGSDMRFIRDKLESSRNFANKLWNASRFVIMNLQDEEGNYRAMSQENLRDEDKWMLSRANKAIEQITSLLEKFELALAGQRIYELIWNEYCDWYIELVKPRLYGEDEKEKSTVRWVLVEVLRTQLRLLHPFMPFITEEIWSYLPDRKEESNPEGFLIKDHWPKHSEENNYEESETIIESAMAVIKAVRGIRVEADAPMSKEIKGVIMAEDKMLSVIKKGSDYITALANMSNLQFILPSDDVPEDSMSAVIEGASIFIARDDLLDYQQELIRLSKEKSRLEKEVKMVRGKLSNQGFLNKAPKEVIEMEKEKQGKYEDMLEKVCSNLLLVEKKLK